MKITLTNDYHNTATSVITKDGALTQRQIKRAWGKLCGIQGCTCGDVAGCRPKQVESVGFDPDEGGRVIEREID